MNISSHLFHFKALGLKILRKSQRRDAVRALNNKKRGLNVLVMTSKDKIRSNKANILV